jgi:hypothetical protein
VPAVTAEFGLGDVIATSRPAHGGPDVRLVTTTAGMFVIKQAEAPWQVELYDEVQCRLNAQGIRQARLLRTVEGSVISERGYAVQEYLPGAVVLRASTLQCQSVFCYLARYDSALADLPVPAELDADNTLWAKTASAEYLVTNLPQLLERFLQTRAERAPIIDAIAVVREALPTMESLPAQPGTRRRRARQRAVGRERRRCRHRLHAVPRTRTVRVQHGALLVPRLR